MGSSILQGQSQKIKNQFLSRPRQECNLPIDEHSLKNEEGSEEEIEDDGEYSDLVGS